MQRIQPTQFTGKTPWEALDIERINGVTIRLHWADEPYIWHVNDGPEVFVVLDGLVDMHTRDKDGEKIWPLATGDIFHAVDGDEHVAHPKGQARVLVIEMAGSV